MSAYPYLIAMAFGALVAVAISWPFWMWRMDRLEKRTIRWLNEQFDKGHDHEGD
jgi:hypothetical protein